MMPSTLSGRFSDPWYTMMFLDHRGPYSLSPVEKAAFLFGEMQRVQQYHVEHCRPYSRFVYDWLEHRSGTPAGVTELPYLPVTVFKDFELRSTTAETMQLKSSATTTGKSSAVFADKTTRTRQSLSANLIWSDFIGTERRPYVVFDAETTVRGTAAMTARGAAIMSLAHLSDGIYFVMQEDQHGLHLDTTAFGRALEKIHGRPFLAYGFTYVLYQAHKELEEYDLSGLMVDGESVFLHSGGWKRMQAMAVDKRQYNELISRVWGLPFRSVLDFYGIVEQVGVPYPDCAAGLKHAPYWADVILRSTDTLQPVEEGGIGLIQLVNCLPLSGPNHSVLTEDLGELVLRDNCECGRRGIGFRFVGRAPRSEIRGCSDVSRA